MRQSNNALMTLLQAEIWKEIVFAERLELFASRERTEWILRTYDPDAESGRSILYFPQSQETRTRTKVRKMDKPDEPFEFEGDEEALAIAAD